MMTFLLERWQITLRSQITGRGIDRKMLNLAALIDSISPGKHGVCLGEDFRATTIVVSSDEWTF